VSISGKLVIVNGGSSTGKSSLISEFVNLSDEPWVTAGVDKFWMMFPIDFDSDCARSGRAFDFRLESEDGQLELVDIHTTALGHRLYTGMHHAIRAFVEVGLNVIVDHIFWEQSWADECARVFSSVDVLMVLTDAPEAVARQREDQRMDRPFSGLSRVTARKLRQVRIEYDLTLDTSTITPLDAALAVKSRLEAGPRPEALKRMRMALNQE